MFVTCNNNSKFAMKLHFRSMACFVSMVVLVKFLLFVSVAHVYPMCTLKWHILAHSGCKWRWSYQQNLRCPETVWGVVFCSWKKQNMKKTGVQNPTFGLSDMAMRFSDSKDSFLKLKVTFSEKVLQKCFRSSGRSPRPSHSQIILCGGTRPGTRWMLVPGACRVVKDNFCKGDLEVEALHDSSRF